MFNKATQMNTLLINFNIDNSDALIFLTHPINSKIFKLEIKRDDNLTIIIFPDNSKIIFNKHCRGVTNND